MENTENQWIRDPNGSAIVPTDGPTEAASIIPKDCVPMQLIIAIRFHARASDGQIDTRCTQRRTNPVTTKNTTAATGSSDAVMNSKTTRQSFLVNVMDCGDLFATGTIPPFHVHVASHHSTLPFFPTRAAAHPPSAPRRNVLPDTKSVLPTAYETSASREPGVDTGERHLFQYIRPSTHRSTAT
jgi:hypothetical protein